MPRGISRYDEARLQGRLWTPRAVRNDLGSWHDFGDLSTVSVSGSVVTVTDKSGKGVTLTEATKPPTWSSGGLYGRPGVIFNGASRLLASNFALPAGTNPAIFVVGAQTAGNVNFSRIVAIDSNGANDYLGLPNTTFDYDGTHASICTGNLMGVAPLPGGSTDYNPHVMVSVSDTSSTLCYVDGTPGTPTATSTNYSTSMTANFLRIGSYTGGSGNDLTGVLGEIVTAGNSLSLGMFRQKIEGYLAWKWGLVDRLIASHPYKNRPPTIGG